MLLIESHGDTRELFTHVLQECGAHVVVVRHAVDALSLLDREPPHAVVFHPRFSDGDGQRLSDYDREVVGKARSVGAVAVAVSGRATPDEDDAIRALGIDVHIVKPVDPESLCVTLAELVKRESRD